MDEKEIQDANKKLLKFLQEADDHNSDAAKILSGSVTQFLRDEDNRRRRESWWRCNACPPIQQVPTENPFPDIKERQDD